MPPARREANGLRRWPRDGRGTRWYPSSSGGYTTLDTAVHPRPVPHSRSEQNQQDVCAQGGQAEQETGRETQILRNWLMRWQTLGESEIGRAGRQAGPLGESGLSGPKAVCWWDFFLLRGGQAVLGLRLIERGPPTLERNLLYFKSTNLSLHLLKKHPCRNIQNNI